MRSAALPDLDLPEQIVRIDRVIAETQKLLAEEGKLQRDRVIAPWQLVVTAMAAGAGLLGAGVALARVLWR